MLIRAQNRKLLINTDNIVGLQLDNARIYAVIDTQHTIILAAYEDAEIAQNRFDELADSICDSITEMS